MEYGETLETDLPRVLKAAVAKRTGIVGGVCVKPVEKAEDRVAWLGFDVPLWSITLSEEVAVRLGIRRVFESCRGVQGAGFFVHDNQWWFNVTFLCRFGRYANPYGFQNLKQGHEPFPEDWVCLPPHLEHMAGTDYEGAWLTQRAKEVWPAHMENIAQAFLRLVDRLASIEVSLDAKYPPVRKETEEEAAQKARNDLNYYQSLARRHQRWLSARPQVG